jgi:predicted transcriptional regulator
MEQTPTRAVEMVRAIRDAIYEETKDLSQEELKQYFTREAAAMRQESQGSVRIREPKTNAAQDQSSRTGARHP